METIFCPFCDVDGPVAFTDEGWDAHECPSCRLLYVSPRPSPADVEDIYKSDEAHGTAIMHMNHFGSSASKLAARMTVSIMQKHLSGGRLLEIGPGSGTFLVAARAAGFNVSAVELNPLQASHIRTELGIECWETLMEAQGPFDAVYHCDVLSHFYDPHEAFTRIHSLLRPGGLHVFETGDGEIAPVYRHLVRNWQFPDHLFIFSASALERLLDSTGFETVKIDRYSIAPLLRVKNAMDRLRRRPSPDAVKQHSVAAERTASGLTNHRVRGQFEQTVVNMLGYPFHFIRYTVGGRMPIKGRPQTVVAVTKKIAA